MQMELGSPHLRRWLASAWLFAGATPGELAPLIAATQELQFAAGAVIYRRDTPATGLYLLTSGRVGIATRNGQGRRVWGHVTAPAIFGELGVLDGQPRWASALALGPSVVYFVPTAAFRAVLERVPSVALRAVALLAQQTRHTVGPRAELPCGGPWEQVSPAMLPPAAPPATPAPPRAGAAGSREAAGLRPAR